MSERSRYIVVKEGAILLVDCFPNASKEELFHAIAKGLQESFGESEVSLSIFMFLITVRAIVHISL